MKNRYSIADKHFWNQIKNDFNNQGGVYKLICMENNRPKKVERFLKTDNNGILYIGKAKDFLNRVIELKKSISPDYNSDSHYCGVRYKSNTEIMKKYPYENLFVILENVSDIDNKEKELLREYNKEFGELPPFNNQI